MIDLNEVMIFVTRLFFTLIALLTLADYLRYRDQTRLNIALIFGSLTFTLLSSVIDDIVPIQGRWLSTLSTLALAAQPYLLMRVVYRFQRVPTEVRGTALVGLLASWVLLIIYLPHLPRTATVAILAYILFVDGYATASFIQGARTAKGVVRYRLRFAALGSGLLALALLVVGMSIIVTTLAQWLTSMTLILTILSGIAYYFGFTPPRWLHRSWQLAEFYRFLREMPQNAVGSGTVETLEHLRRFATQAVGGVHGQVALWDDVEKMFQMPDGLPLPKSLEDVPAIQKLLHERQPALIQDPSLIPQFERLCGELSGADTLYAVPMSTPERLWGLLFVFKRGSLFPKVDLDLLALFTGQSAITLEYTFLLDQLRRRTDDLEASYGELESFSYSISHDLRAPLRAIDGFSNILQEDFAAQLPPEANRFLNLIRENAAQMGELIDDLLNFSRLSRQAILKRSVALTDLVRDVADTLQDQLDHREVELSIGNLPDCEADPALLKQVFVNLLSNAFKFTKACDVARVEVGALQKDGESVYFVKDNGIGFDMQYAHKLFGVFQRLHRAEDYEGTGVGLAIVQRIIQRHGGRIWVESELNRGTVFYFTLA